ncbi:hypothetical protein [Gilliamella intestini]|uniref:Uncharacterized protein n=1 Tax=Gilliamella intestini TaxID=1798183 RepID=A0A1C4AMC0_9GAMM|nr:hypothetical protein [Gilliamella intestini]SCB95812.1 hypothetical protein GA0061080_101235 [Gilliamella intestini]
MKKNILSICVISSVLLITGCDDKKIPDKKISEQSFAQLPTAVINSYLFHTEPELLPNNKLIKQQKITGSGSNKIINYNIQGYVANYDLDGLYGEVNYDSAKYIFGNNRKQYNITFDTKKNILTIQDSDGDIVANSEFDEQGHLVETTLSHFAGNNVIFNNQIIYENNRVELVSYNAYVLVDDKTKFPILAQQKDIIYNTNNQVEKTITKTYQLTSNGEIIINNQNEQEVELTETCTYDNYNENQDWTKAICVKTGVESGTVELTRTIEYQ